MTPQPIPSTGPRPRTEAGRMLAKYRGGGYVNDADVLAIEAEARAQSLAAVEEAVRGLPHPSGSLNAAVILRADVLAVLAKLQEDEQ